MSTRPTPTAPAFEDDAESIARFTPQFDLVDEVGDAAAELAAANELMRRSLADGTSGNYRSSWRDWERFCRKRNWTSFPADPMHVCTYLTVVGAEVAEGALARDDNGEPIPGRLRPNTVALRVSALNRAHRVAGLPAPGEHPNVVALVRGLKRTFGAEPLLAKAALDLPLLEQLLDAIDQPPVDTVRDVALATLRDETDATHGQLARLRWDAIDLDTHPVPIRLPSPTRSPEPLTCQLRERPGDPTCPVAALRALRAVSDHEHVFAQPGTGRPMTRQGVRQALRRLERDMSAGDKLALRRGVKALHAPTLRQLRDRALLLCGWWAALRRSNLVAFRWRDVRIVGGDWELARHRTKTDQTGERRYRSWLIAAPDGWPCPIEAMTAWRDALAAELGVAAIDLDEEPIFVPIDRHGNIRRDGKGRPVPLSGDGVCEIVQTRAAQAGLDADTFGAHSLRSGFITEALTDDKMTIAEVQDITDHTDINVLVDYRRVANRHKNHPVKRMFEHARQTEATPTPPDPADVLRARLG